MATKSKLGWAIDGKVNQNRSDFYGHHHHILAHQKIILKTPKTKKVKLVGPFTAEDLSYVDEHK